MAGDDEYLLGYRRVEQERLVEPARQLAHESEWLFDQVGVGIGARVVEIGCGPEGSLGLLATRMGPSGTVVGVERSADAVELAQAMVRAGVSATSKSSTAMGAQPGCLDRPSMWQRRVWSW